MIVVKVELHSAITGAVTELGHTVIFNDGTGTRARGNYVVEVARKGARTWRPDRPVRRGHVVDYPREAYSVWRLVIRALRSAFPEEK